MSPLRGYDFIGFYYKYAAPTALEVCQRASQSIEAIPVETSAKEVAQVSQSVVSPTSKSAGHGNIGKSADWEIRDTADLEVCATKRRFAEVSRGAKSM
jgi:hypothetical protein